LNVALMNLGGGSKLVLSAPAGGQFVINNSGAFQVAGTSKILVNGSLTPYDVVFNQTSSQNVSFSGGSSVNGIVLAPWSNISPDAGTLAAAVIAASTGRTITIASGEVILHPPMCPQ